MEYFNLLPEEITLDIISRLPTENVLECKLVCRNWRSRIRHPSFSKMHLQHLNHPSSDSGKMGFIAMTYIGRGKGHFQYFEYNENHETTPVEKIRRVNLKRPFGRPTIFLGSYNGLICFYESIFCVPVKTYICNPITREYIMLPEINTLTTIDHGGSGFGYVSSTNEYKVVTVLFEYNSKFKEVFIYTLGSGNGWRSLGKFNLGIKGFWVEGSIFVKGVLYWLDSESKMIVSFDLAEEKFFENLSLPPSSPEYVLYDNPKLWVLGGCLSFSVYGLVNDAECWDVWILKNKDDNQGVKQQEVHHSLGWHKVFTVNDRGSFAVTKSYTVLTYKGNHINLHDLEASTSKIVVEFKEYIDGVFRHENTLLSLTELGEEDTKRMETVENEETKIHD